MPKDVQVSEENQQVVIEETELVEAPQVETLVEVDDDNVALIEGDPVTTAVVKETETVVVPTEGTVEVVEVGEQGPAGPAGPEGPQGPLEVFVQADQPTADYPHIWVQTNLDGNPDDFIPHFYDPEAP